MLIFGPHLQKDEAKPNNALRVATEHSWDVIQTFWGNPRAVSVNTNIPADHAPQKRPMWVLHAGYLVHVGANGEKMKRASVQHFRDLCVVASKLGCPYVVGHMGATKGYDTERIIERVWECLEGSGLSESLASLGVEFLVENVATVAEFNQTSRLLAELVSTVANVSWCLDIAHAHAAGVDADELVATIREFPPSVCHGNLPGSDFGCGKDRHGWLHKSTHRKRIWYWRTVMEAVVAADIPIVMEGASMEGEMADELAAVRAAFS